MSGEKTEQSAPGPAAEMAVVLRLYIASDAPNSVQAVANLIAICNKHLGNKYKLEIIDVLESPSRALADGIRVTPSLAKVAPSPAVKIVGNLGDLSTVLDALGLEASVD